MVTAPANAYESEKAGRGFGIAFAPRACLIPFHRFDSHERLESVHGNDIRKFMDNGRQCVLTVISVWASLAIYFALSGSVDPRPFNLGR